jgi:glucose-6-phosphate-specific signal transduction histidine kinase
MSSNSEDDDDPVMRSSTERYDRVGADLDWFIILASASSIFFGFLLNITVNPTSYFTFLDNVILLAALYAVTIATVMFILPVIFHASHYRKFDVERFLLKAKESVLMGIICVMLAMYLGLGLALDSKLSVMIAYGLPSLPFIFFFIEFFRHMRE